jgi:hypothetical protein
MSGGGSAVVQASTQFTLQLATADAASVEELDELARGLREELLQLEVNSVEPAPAGPAPAGTRAVDIADIGNLVITVAQSAAAIVSLVTAVQSWLNRNRQGTVTLAVGGDELKLSGLSTKDQRELVNAWIARRVAKVEADSGGQA